jgi:hypothetical protein
MLNSANSFVSRLFAFSSIWLVNAAIAQYCDPQYIIQIAKYDSLYQARDFYGAAIAGEKALKHCLNCNNPEDQYAVAAAYALAGEKNEALRQLSIAAEKGYSRLEHFVRDPDFRTLVNDDSYNEIIKTITQNSEDAEKQLAHHAELAIELQTILELDQSVREETSEQTPSDERIRQMMIMDSSNRVRVCDIIDKHGWLGPRQVGREGNQALFLVIQHADQTTQEKYLPVMREAVRWGNAEFSELAMLEDRVLMGQGKKQIYGSQIGFNDQDGSMYLVPVEDPDHLDERRSCAGMVPIAEYLSYFGLTWSLEEYKKVLPALEEYERSRH